MLKKLYYFLIFLLPFSAMAQSLSLFDVDASNFPTIKAKLFAFDGSCKQITNLNSTDFELKENGAQRNVTIVSCPPLMSPNALSSVLVMDASGSMGGGGKPKLAKEAANAWVEGLPLGKSECAITSFDNKSYLNQDFTTDKNKLLNAINNFNTLGSTDFDAAMLNPPAGGLLISKKAIHKRVIVLLSDGHPSREPQTSLIIAEANMQNAVIYCVTLNTSCPQSMRDMSSQTGGQWFENVTTVEQAKHVYQQILQTAQGGAPCTMEWQSTVSCFAGITNIEVQIPSFGLTTKTSYQTPSRAVAKLEFDPTIIKFADPTPGEYATPRTVRVTARNADFTVSDISTKIPVGFDINPKNFRLKDGENIELTVEYFPADSGYNYCKFDLESQPCLTKFYVNGGWKGKKHTIRTITIINPNGGEVFVAGSDTVITWDGISPDEPVKIEYSFDKGANWITIADSAKGSSYNWRVPKTPSNKCLARVTAEAKTVSYCDNPNAEICSKVWMSCNLNVDTYRNGDPIPEVTDSTEWENLKTGAWCYYNNDPANGDIYGKLYNWYAVNDPRGLAPDGWHIPTDAEWTELANCLGGTSFAGGKLKSTGTIEGGDGLWKSLNRGATNEIGFSAHPGGYRKYYGSFTNIGIEGYWWSVTEADDWYIYGRFLNHHGVFLGKFTNRKNNGFSVRCVKD